MRLSKIPKIGFGMIIFNGNYVVKEAIESIYPFATQILIAEGPVKYWQDQGYTKSTDGTIEALREIKANDKENKINIVHSQFSEKDDQCNAYMIHRRDDLDYIWNLDSDEVFFSEDVEALLRIMTDYRVTSVGFRSLSFYGGFNRIIGGFEEDNEFIRIRKVYPGSYWQTHRPPTMTHVEQNIWPHSHIDGNRLYGETGIGMYHYSYVFPDQVYNKVKYYKAAVSKDNCIDNYFDRVYLPWVNGGLKQKMEIEDRFDGVHEWKPECRSSARTKEFNGMHPPLISKNMKILQEKFEWQIKEYL